MFKPTRVDRVVGWGGNTPTSVTVSEGNQDVPSIAKTALAKLNDHDLQQVRKLRGQLAVISPMSLVNYGSDIQSEIAILADKVLQNTGSNEIEFIGGKMTDIILKAKSTSVSALNGTKSTVPFIGAIIDRLRNNKEKVMANFTSAKDQIEKIVTEVDVVTTGLNTRMVLLQELYDANSRQYHDLDLHIIAAKMSMEEMTAQTNSFAATLPADADPYDVQQLSDARRHLTNMDITISNLERMRITALQGAPQIRMMQQNSAQLIDKFQMIKKNTVPQWKRQFALALTIDEQRKGAELANMIDDTNNEFARKTAEMLKQTSIAVATSNQRGVFDIETLEFVQQQLISSAEEVLQITNAGTQTRKEISKRLGEMKQEMQQKLS